MASLRKCYAITLQLVDRGIKPTAWRTNIHGAKIDGDLLDRFVFGQLSDILDPFLEGTILSRAAWQELVDSGIKARPEFDKLVSHIRVVDCRTSGEVYVFPHP